jgi:hypothetical protein
MDAVILNVSHSFESDARRCLPGSFNAPKADDFLDRLFELAATFASVHCTLANDRMLRIQSHNTQLHELAIPLAMTKPRMLCARLGVRFGEWANWKLASYGEVVEFEYLPTKKYSTVRYENTTATQAFAIDAPSQGKCPQGLAARSAACK